jgi:hypothetical protein
MNYRIPYDGPAYGCAGVYRIAVLLDGDGLSTTAAPDSDS